MYWYKTDAVDDERKLNAQNYEYLDTIGLGFPTVRNSCMSTQKIPVQNARDLTGEDAPSFWRDGFEMVSLDKASALQTSLIDGFDIAN